MTSEMNAKYLSTVLRIMELRSLATGTSPRELPGRERAPRDTRMIRRKANKKAVVRMSV